MGSDHCPVTVTFSFPETFKEINENVLAECKLRKGNITKNFGRLDSFFMLSKTKQTNEKSNDILIEAEAETETEADNVVNIVEKEKVRTFKKKKISDFFKSHSAHSEEEEVEIDISSTSTTTIFGDQFQPIPKCPIHNEPCKLFRVNKSGANRGKKFYTCARPVGAKDDPEGKCNFFQWVGCVNAKLNNKSNNDKYKD